MSPDAQQLLLMDARVPAERVSRKAAFISEAGVWGRGGGVSAAEQPPGTGLGRRARDQVIALSLAAGSRKADGCWTGLVFIREETRFH